MKLMKSILTILFLLGVVSMQAQDKLYKRTGEMTQVKVTEVGEEFVVYKMFNNQDGPNYKIRKDALDKIVYQNGVTENYSSAVSATVTTTTVTTTASVPVINPSTLGKNIVSFDFLSILFNEVGFNYERILDNGFIGIKVPLILGVAGTRQQNTPRDYPNIYQTGIDLNLYPTGQGETKYFIGPAIRFGLYGEDRSRVSVDYSYDYYNNVYTSPVIVDRKFNGVAFQVNNGIMFQPAKHFNVTLLFGVGLQKFTPTRSYEGYNNASFSRNYAVFQANLGYRF